MKVSTYQPRNRERHIRSNRLPIQHSGRQRVRKILLLFLSLAALLACVRATYAVEESAGTSNLASGGHTPQLEQEVRNARGLRMAESGQAEYTGEFFRVGGRKVQLLRSLEKIAVRYLPSEGSSVMNQLQAITRSEGGFLVEHEVAERGITVLQTPKFESLAEMAKSIEPLEQVAGVTRAVPVYIHEESGLELIPTDEFIVKVAADADLGVLQALNDALGVIMVRPLWGTTDQFILAIPDCTPEELLSTCEIYWQDPAIEWAHPNFLGEAVKCDVRPNDPLYSDQWHLPRIQAPQAWDATTGSSQIVIAVIDDGMDLAHEDLRGNLPSNSLDPENGVDDDNNGYADDTNGWNFWAGDKDAGPADPEDNHGTSTAGVAAAKGNNNLGVAGCAFNCTLMPLKVWKGTGPDRLSYPGVVEALYYAAGRAKNGGSWRGADVISISLGFSEVDAINDALAFAATQGRGGKGCPIFCATGNSASNYLGWKVQTGDFPEGTYYIEFEYYKDEADTSGQDEDAVWITNVVLPDSGSTRERFDAPSMPSYWSGAGNVGFSIVDDPNHAYGTGRYVARSGSIGNKQNSILRTKSFQLVRGKDLAFQTWISTEKGSDSTPNYPPSGNDGDWLFVWFRNTDGRWARYIIDAGIPGHHWNANPQNDRSVVTGILFPASHPDTIAVGASTDFNYRSHYSQYGAGLDFVAPSNGGTRQITTTDRTGAAGYDAGNYTSTFGGTSSSTPLAAGVAALMLSKNPDLTAQQLREIMRNTCDKIGPVPYGPTSRRNDYYGYGRINARAALGVEDREKDAMKLIASDGRPGDQFGSSVSVSGDYAIVGAKDSAYLFKREGTNWVEQDKLVPPSQRTYYHDLGRGVSISGNYAVVAAMDTAHVYERSGTDWTQTTMLMAYPYESGDGFASSLSISGDYIIVGASHRTIMGYRNRGSAFIFKRYGSTWTQHQQLTSWDFETNWDFGESVSISGDYAIVGIPQTSISYYKDLDRAYIFERHGQSWERAAKLISPQGGTRFGRSVSINGNYAAVRGADSVYIYERGNSGWQQQDQLTASDFGESISISTDYLIIGASDSAHVFKRTGSKWTQKARLTSPAGETGVGFGNSVSLSGDYAIVGAPYDDSRGSDSGAAYVFRLSKISD